ncbi:type VII secretion protein EccB [Nocardia sp. NPDC051990]|uniref:type VII secretion protein EccB n=1 Tax=Nocardia sp. NPDC051990 TaxID=3155285 RepID=UPI003440435D
MAALARGPLLGIPGVPAALPGPADSDKSEWTLCDDVSSGLQTIVLAGAPQLGPAISQLLSGEGLLASDGDTTYLIYDGKHARVDMNSSAITSALKVRGLRPRPIGAGLLNATAGVPDLTLPAIPDAGAPGPVQLRNLAVGTVIQVDSITTATLYVVLANGLQPLSPFAAEVLRSANSMGQAAITVVAPDAISELSVVKTLPVDQFPAERPRIVSADEQPVACSYWSRDRGDTAGRLQLLVGKQAPLATTMRAVTLVGDGQGESARAAYIPPSTGEFVQITGIEPDSTRREVLFFITDTGVRFGIPDTATAQTLGLSEPKLAPWQIIAQLPAGPMLDRQSALVAHDVVPTGTY